MGSGWPETKCATNTAPHTSKQTKTSEDMRNIRDFICAITPFHFYDPSEREMVFSLWKMHFQEIIFHHKALNAD